MTVSQQDHAAIAAMQDAPVAPAPDACGWSPAPGFRCIQPEGHGGIGHVVAVDDV